MVGRAHMMNFNGLVSGQLDVPTNPYLVLNIRRDHLLRDTLNNILSQNILDFKKPLKVCRVGNYTVAFKIFCV